MAYCRWAERAAGAARAVFATGRGDVARSGLHLRSAAPASRALFGTLRPVGVTPGAGAGITSLPFASTRSHQTRRLSTQRKNGDAYSFAKHKNHAYGGGADKPGFADKADKADKATSGHTETLHPRQPVTPSRFDKPATKAAPSSQGVVVEGKKQASAPAERVTGGADAPSTDTSAPSWMVQDHWHRLSDPHTVSVVGAPMQYGQGLDGTEAAPDALRDTGLARSISLLGWRVRDRGNVDIVPPSLSDPRGESMPRHSYAVGVSNQRLCNTVYQAASDGHFVLTLGGDHCIAIGSLSGALAYRPSLGVIWVDAHADINAPGFSPSSNAHGMPVAFLTKMVDVKSIPGYMWMEDVPQLHAEKLVYIGLRDLDEFEKQLIRKMGIKTFTMQHIDKYGIGKVMEMTLDHLAGKAPVPLHMSFDIDGCDPSIAPATGTRVPGGLNFRESSYVCESVAESGLLVSMDMVEVNPLLATRSEADATLDLATSLVGSALGKYIL